MPVNFALAAINIISFLLMAWDKHCARNELRRIRESTLWIAALCFGAPGETLGMFAFHHKTRHMQFRWGLPALAAIEIAILILIVIKK
ncbi:MAG: DUF1294 domain-containing protein [Oscillospiraceae bacterium]|nr:DUF1294 domain-containing protein [Oscillospiraceae bacterium]